MSKKLLVVVGPTATGKTSLALSLAKTHEGELVSADSRQVYKKMDIGTGKDLPPNVKCQMSNVRLENMNVGYYEIDGVKIWGYDLVKPNEKFSVSQYVKVVRKIIKSIWQMKKLPILVGGTGLYIKAVLKEIPTLNIPPDTTLRKGLLKKVSVELFEILAGLDPMKAASLNTSDRKNPRRLIRAIEIASYKIKEGEKQNSDRRFIIDSALKIGLTAPKEFLASRVKKRVSLRINNGFEKEVKDIVGLGLNLSNQSMQSLGYKQFYRYLKGECSVQDAVREWEQEEIKYVKRQLTWFNTDKEINWFDISLSNWSNEVENKVRKWHNKETKFFKARGD